MKDHSPLAQIDKGSFFVTLNTKVDQYNSLHMLFANNEIEVIEWAPEGLDSPSKLTLGFATNLNFRDVYYLCVVLKTYGLELVYPLRGSPSQMLIGSYLLEMDNTSKYAYAEPITIDKLLVIDPEINMSKILSENFKALSSSIEPEQDVLPSEISEHEEYINAVYGPDYIKELVEGLKKRQQEDTREKK
jgi:hypothetical protein